MVYLCVWIMEFATIQRGGGLYFGCWAVREELAKAEAGIKMDFYFPNVSVLWG